MFENQSNAKPMIIFYFFFEQVIRTREIYCFVDFYCAKKAKYEKKICIIVNVMNFFKRNTVLCMCIYYEKLCELTEVKDISFAIIFELLLAFLWFVFLFIVNSLLFCHAKLKKIAENVFM